VGAKVIRRHNFATESKRAYEPPPPPPENETLNRARIAVIGTFLVIISWAFLYPRDPDVEVVLPFGFVIPEPKTLGQRQEGNDESKENGTSE
jgi:hypothetical protein